MSDDDVDEVARAALDGLRAAPPALVAVGGSAGALEGLFALLDPLPPTAPPIVVVLHVPEGASTQLPAVIGARTRLRAVEACDKDPCRPGTVHVAPPGYHLLIERGGTLALSIDDVVTFARPSIDVLLESAAWALGPGVLAVVLSGASADGAAGTAAVRAHGGRVWVQEPSTAPFATMPTAALGHAHAVLPPARMGAVLAAWAHGPSTPLRPTSSG